jgi:myo-inositol-1(or 4)-monophosphatase
VDRRSEEFLIAAIRDRFPTHSIVAEESGKTSGDPQHAWYIDPLDGTVNYAHGVPFFAVSIACEEHGKITLGVVYDPLREEMFTAEASRGAYLNGSKIRASNNQTLIDSLLVTGFPYDIQTNPRNNLDHFRHFSLVAQGVRRLGSAALDACYVACGRLEGFWEAHISPWDIAAAGLIAREAGATVTNITGNPDFLAPPPSVIVANPSIHRQLLDYFRAVIPSAGTAPGQRTEPGK